MITKYNWLNAGIITTIIIDIILLNIYVIQKIDNNKIMDTSTIKVLLIIISIVIVILAVAKLIIFLTDKNPKKEQ